MKLFNILAILITLSAGFSYLNYRFIRLPNTIGLMVIALLVSLGLAVLGSLGFGLREDAYRLLASIDFDETLLHVMLSFLLFAGALHINLENLAKQKYIIGLLATLGVLGSTAIIAFISRWVLTRLGIDLPMIYCLLFGALISPTDPIAVLGILKKAGVSESLETNCCWRPRRHGSVRARSFFQGGIGRRGVRAADRMVGLLDAQKHRQLPG